MKPLFDLLTTMEQHLYDNGNLAESELIRLVALAHKEGLLMDALEAVGYDTDLCYKKV